MIIIICMSKSPRKLEYREREREKKKRCWVVWNLVVFDPDDNLT